MGVPIFDSIVRFLIDNFIFVGLFLLAGYYIYHYFDLKKKKSTEPISRSEIERQKFLERMSENQSKWKVFKRGNIVMGKITHFREFSKFKDDKNTKLLTEKFEKEIKKSIDRMDKINDPDQLIEIMVEIEPTYQAYNKLKEESEVKIGQLVVKPYLFEKLGIVSPFGKSKCFQINMKKAEHDLKLQALILPKSITFDYIYGIYYDLTIEKEHIKIIKTDNIMRTDLDLQASRYFVKSQEQCVFSPDVAQQMALKEKELQIELAKRKGIKETL
jgi:hypothetical protein